MKNHVVFVACGLFFAFPFSLYPQGTDRDLSLSISLNKSAGIAGEPFVAYIEITNICAHEKKNLPAITGDGDVQDTLFLDLIKTDASGSKEKDITCRQIPPSRLQYQLVNLRPGEKMTASVTIADKYPITEAGIYKIKCYYKVEKNLFGSAGGNLVTEYWKGTLSSEDVSLTIELPQSDVDKRVLRTILRSDGTSDLTWLQSRLLSGEKATAELKHKGIDDCVKSTYAKYAIALFLGNERMVTLRPDSAIELFRKLIDNHDMFEMSDEALLGLARAYWEKKNVEEARKNLMKIISDFPNSNSVDSAKALLRTIEASQ